jgi:single-strand DNA-binding protein
MPTVRASSTSNQVLLKGIFAGEPVLRVLPSGDELVSFRLTVQRPPGGRVRVDSIECASTRASVRRLAIRCVAGAEIEVEGSLRRRFWRSTGGGPASRYEVEVSSMKVSKPIRAPKSQSAGG